VQENKVKKLKKNDQERDFLCVVSDAFRVFARRSSMMLGSAWACACHLYLDPDGAYFPFFRHMAADHQHCYHGYHIPNGVPDSEHAKP
jgi:hypothetical protein